MHKDPLIHTAVSVRFQWTIEMKDKTHVLGLDMLLKYGQDDLLQNTHTELRPKNKKKVSYYYIVYGIDSNIIYNTNRL